MTKTPSTPKPESRSELFYPACGLTLVLLAGAYFLRNERVWGLNFAAFLPWWAGVIELVVLLLGLAAALFFAKERPQEETSAGARWHLAVLVMAVAAAVLFWLFRARTYFLGDGYQILSFLSSQQPFLKPSEYGTAWLTLMIYHLIGSGKSAALASEQIVSIGSGVLYILGCGWLAANFFTSIVDRALFLAGMITGGVTLLFFGYVEDYSPLVVSVLAFIIVGNKIASGSLNRFWILLPLGIGIFFHALALAMIPAAIYILLSDTRFSKGYGRLRTGTKRLAAITILVIIVLIGAKIYSDNLFLQLAILPPIPHELTVPGYSLFSPRHLIDFLNLLFVLIPGLLILLSVMRGQQSVIKGRPARFLGWLTIATLLTAFGLDPKLGMPRDWDLFAFALVPLLVLLFWLVLSGWSRYRRSAVVLTIAVAAVGLSSRVAVLASPRAALQYAAYIRDLDPVKTRNLWFVIMQYYRDNGDPATALEIQNEWSRRFPELNQNRKAYEAYYQGRYRETIQICRAILKFNPTFADAWLNAGVAFRALNQTDSALHYLKIADALSPYTPSVYINLAAVMVDRGQVKQGEKLLDKAIAVDSNMAAAYYQYARIQAMLGYRQEYIRYLMHMAKKEDADPAMLKELTNAQLQDGNMPAARAAFNLAVRRGLDSTAADSLLKAYPQLGQ